MLDYKPKRLSYVIRREKLFCKEISQAGYAWKEFDEKRLWAEIFPKTGLKKFSPVFFLSLKKKGDEFAKNPTDKSENTAKLAML